MRVFVTGATGFIGSYLVPELLAEGHRVIGLCRSDAGADRLTRAGATPLRGDVNDLERIRSAVTQSDGVIHTAFNHDLSDVKRHSEDDRRTIAALGELLGPDRPLVITSGTGLVGSHGGNPATEDDPPPSSADVPRAASEEAAAALSHAGGRAIVVRLPQVHDTHRAGRLSWHVEIARRHGRVAYVGAGTNRLAAAHVSDVVRLYRLVLERGAGGACYHAVAESGVAMRDIAAAIGAGSNLPVESIAPADAAAYFGSLAHLAGLDLAASGERTQRELDWHPAGPDLITDLRAMDDRS